MNILVQHHQRSGALCPDGTLATTTLATRSGGQFDQIHWQFARETFAILGETVRNPTRHPLAY